MADKVDNNVIIVDRSRVEARILCEHKRYNGYDLGGTGLRKVGSKYEADFGQALHTSLSTLLEDGAFTEANRLQLVEDIRLAVHDNIDNSSTHTMQEQIDLGIMLVRAWADTRLKLVLEEYDILELEQEHTVVFLPGDYLVGDLARMMRPVGMMYRPDTILKRKSDGVVFSMDFKTTSRASDDWAVSHERSLQTALYTACMIELYGNDYGGIWYEGLVKGYREMDNAKSSPFQGTVIQYGSPLYGWSKGGKVGKYSTGSQRVYLPDYMLGFHNFYTDLNKNGLVVTTLPSQPLEYRHIVGQMIIAENRYAGDLEVIREQNPSDQRFLTDTLLQQNFGACYKYGSKHPCEFVELCHGRLGEEQLAEVYTKRVPHHDQEKGSE